MILSTGHAHWVNVFFKSMSWKHSPSVTVVAFDGVLKSLALVVVVDSIVGVIPNVVVGANDGTSLLTMHQ